MISIEPQSTEIEIDFFLKCSGICQQCNWTKIYIFYNFVTFIFLPVLNKANIPSWLVDHTLPERERESESESWFVDINLHRTTGSPGSCHE